MTHAIYVNGVYTYMSFIYTYVRYMHIEYGWHTTCFRHASETWNDWWHLRDWVFYTYANIWCMGREACKQASLYRRMYHSSCSACAFVPSQAHHLVHRARTLTVMSLVPSTGPARMTPYFEVSIYEFTCSQFEICTFMHDTCTTMRVCLFLTLMLLHMGH